MLRYFSISLAVVSFIAAGTLRAATKPHPGPASEATLTRTNQDMERLGRILSLISIVGQDTFTVRNQADRHVESTAYESFQNVLRPMSGSSHPN